VCVCVQVGALCCSLVVDAFKRENAINPRWRIPQRMETLLQVSSLILHHPRISLGLHCTQAPPTRI
jgi:hypothetical protein